MRRARPIPAGSVAEGSRRGARPLNAVVARIAGRGYRAGRVQRRLGWSTAGRVCIAGSVPALGLLLVSCAPRAMDGGFDSPHPQARLYATRQAAEEQDLSAIPNLIEGLDADDPAVRFMSINALRYLTGHDFGYHYYAPEWERAAAVERWVAAFEAGELHVVEEDTAGPTEGGPVDAGSRRSVEAAARPGESGSGGG